MDPMLAPWTVLSPQSLSSSGKAKPDSTPAAVPAAVVTKGGDSAAMCDLFNLMNIPKVATQLTTRFHNQFYELIDNKLDYSQLKLTRRLQYTPGAVKSAIKNCALISGESGHKQARDILRNRFGNKHIITQTIISQLKTGKRVTKPHELQQWADDLDMTGAVLEKLGKNLEVDTQQMIVVILERCQLHIEIRWCRKHRTVSVAYQNSVVSQTLDHRRWLRKLSGF